MVFNLKKNFIQNFKKKDQKMKSKSNVIVFVILIILIKKISDMFIIICFQMICNIVLGYSPIYHTASIWDHIYR